MTLSDYCAECGEHGAGPRQLCEACLPLYPASDLEPLPLRHAPLVDDECDYPSCRSDMAEIVPCRRKQDG